MTTLDGLEEARLRRFARLAAPLLRGAAAAGLGPRACRDRAGAGLEFLDLAPYRPGDEVRHVDWRQTGRRGRLIVRRYRDEMASDWFICVDGSASMRGDKWRLAARLACALGYALLHGGHRPALAIVAGDVEAWCPPGRGRRQFAAVTRQLLDYRVPGRGGASLPGLCAERLGRAGNLVLISDFLRADAMAGDVRRLRAAVAAGSAIELVARDDVLPVAGGDLLLEERESGGRRRIELTPETQARATAALAAHRERVRDVCIANGLRLSSFSGDDDWERALLTHLGA